MNKFQRKQSVNELFAEKKIMTTQWWLLSVKRKVLCSWIFAWII